MRQGERWAAQIWWQGNKQQGRNGRADVPSLTALQQLCRLPGYSLSAVSHGVGGRMVPRRATETRCCCVAVVIYSAGEAVEAVTYVCWSQRGLTRLTYLMIANA